MKWRKANGLYIVRLEKDELLMESLIKFAADNDVKSAWLSGLGGVQWVDLGYYHLDRKEYGWHRIDKLLELATAQGNITQVEEQPFIHLHATFSGPDSDTYAGHVKEASIGGTGEFLITPFDESVTRTLSDDVGLKLLDL